MKNMTLGFKVASGFGLLLLIAAILGIIGVINMNNATYNAERMANEYAPEVEMASGMERNFLKTRLSIVTYTFAEKGAALAEGYQRFERVQERLNEAKKLAQDYPALVVLKEKVTAAQKALDTYIENVKALDKAYHQKDAIRASLDTAAGTFMKEITAMLDGQNKKMIHEIESFANADKLKERHEKITLTNEVIALGNGLRISNFASAAHRDNQRLMDGIESFEKDFIPTLESLKKISYDPANIQQLEAVRKAGLAYMNALKEMSAIDEKVARIDAELKESGAAALTAAEETARAGVAGTQKLAGESKSSLETASLVMIVGLIAAIVLGLILAFFIIRSITKPVVDAVKNISDANGQVLSASEQIADSATSLAEGATEQASAVEEVSATVEESTAINNQNAENSSQANILAQEANKAASSGNHKIQELMKAMERITESSERIAKIIKTIDEIAFQTNLLALNAAVEAARAGEHGLGFAVVADEVKNLAQRSADAAKETAGIIEEAIEEIKNGNQIANDTNQSFAEILEKAQKTSDLIGEISVSVKEQAQGMNQIATTMGQVDQVTQTNAASSEEAAAAAEELNAQAAAMMESTLAIAAIVGYKVEFSHTAPSQSKPRQIAHLHLNTGKGQSGKKPAPKTSRQANTKRDTREEVFPLEEEDMREF